MPLPCDNSFDSEVDEIDCADGKRLVCRTLYKDDCPSPQERATRAFGRDNLKQTEHLLPWPKSCSRSPRSRRSTGACGGHDLHPKHRFHSAVRRLHLYMRKRHENVDEEDRKVDQMHNSSAIEDYIIPDVEQPLRSTMNNFSPNKVFIGNPKASPTEEKISFGMKIETIEEHGYIRHFCVDVESGGLADQFNFRNIDELLMINSDAVFNESKEEVLKLFSHLRTAEAITMITRRYLDIEKLDDDGLKDEDIQVKYIRIIGEVLVTEEDDDKEGKLERRHSVCIKSENSEETSASKIQFNGRKTLVHIEYTSSQRLRFNEGKLKMWKYANIDTDDKNIEFETLHYVRFEGIEVTNLCIIKAAHSNHFLKVGSDNSVTMEERDTNGGSCPRDRKGLLFKPESLNEEQIYKVYSDDQDERRYLKWDTEAGCRVEESDEAGGNPDFTFKIHNV